MIYIYEIKLFFNYRQIIMLGAKYYPIGSKFERKSWRKESFRIHHIKNLNADKIVLGEMKEIMKWDKSGKITIVEDLMFPNDETGDLEKPVFLIDLAKAPFSGPSCFKTDEKRDNKVSAKFSLDETPEVKEELIKLWKKISHKYPLEKTATLFFDEQYTSEKEGEMFVENTMFKTFKDKEKKNNQELKVKFNLKVNQNKKNPDLANITAPSFHTDVNTAFNLGYRLPDLESMTKTEKFQLQDDENKKVLTSKEKWVDFYKSKGTDIIEVIPYDTTYLNVSEDPKLNRTANLDKLADAITNCPKDGKLIILASIKIEPKIIGSKPRLYVSFYAESVTYADVSAKSTGDGHGVDVDDFIKSTSSPAPPSDSKPKPIDSTIEKEAGVELQTTSSDSEGGEAEAEGGDEAEASGDGEESEE